jgi:hypothetical protein
VSTPPRHWNAVRFAAASGDGHVESYFLKLTAPDQRRALWLKATILSRLGGDAVAEAWAVSFDKERAPIGTKRVIPYESARFSSEHMDVEVGEVRFREGRVEGAVASGGHRIEYTLDFSTDAPPLVPFPSLRMYEGKLPSTKLVSPHPEARFFGTYRVDGEEIRVEGWRGMQGHNWGTRHTELYAWGQCNQWHGVDDLVFEGATARIKVGPVLSPRVTWAIVWYRGVRYELNGPRSLLKSRGAIDDYGRWTFSAEGQLASVEGEFTAKTSDFAGLYYENPNGTMTYCLNSKLAHGRIRLRVRGRPDLVATTDAAALEIGTKDPRHGVAMLV